MEKLKHIFLLKPGSGETTVLSRAAVVAYWAGVVALLFFVFLTLPLKIDILDVSHNYDQTAMNTDVAVGLLLFAAGRVLAFILGNR